MKGLKAKLNDRIEIMWNKKIYKSTVQDINHGELTINIPVAELGYLPAAVGEVLNIIHFQEDGEVYQYSEAIKARKNEGKLAYLIINYPNRAQKVQRRDYVRVKYNQIIKYTKGKDTKDIKLINKGFLIDLSGGGMKVKIKEQIKSGEKITTIINYGSHELKITGSVVRSEIDAHGERVYGITFDEISSFTRESIIKIVFDIMRKQRELL
ncbi:flagellar brake protein [Alloiococcus sp. CFN-8]|uniref:flagellar brake protein n=1 Tax=Alloiococcus sp. CFN-8 TaxID=3416081 RepID=UPI003CF7EBBB